jgi:hypothetical protein
VKKAAGLLTVTLKVNDVAVATGTVPVSAPLMFTANDCLDIGTDLGSPVSVDYYDQAPFPFTGKIDQVQVKYLGSPAEVQEEKKQTDAVMPAAD